RRPPWDGVHSSEPIYSNGPNGTNAIFGSYAHELANILGERLSPLGTSGGQPYGMTYGNPGEPEGDPDIGAQVEICVLVRCRFQLVLQCPDRPQARQGSRMSCHKAVPRTFLADSAFRPIC